MESISQPRAGIGALVLCLFLACKNICAAASPNEHLTLYESSAIERAVVRIDVEFLDFRRLPIGRPLRGHGVVISEDGLVLTAAHVLFPAAEEFRKRGARDYRVIVTVTNNVPRRKLIRVASIPARDIRSHALTRLNRELAGCRDDTDLERVCLVEPPLLNEDYALLLVPSDVRPSGDKLPPWNVLDVLGPEDIVDCVKSENSTSHLFVASDFALTNMFSIAPAIGDTDPKTSSFRVTDGTRIIEGASGSPLLLISSAPRRIIQVAGIVSRTGVDNSTFEAALTNVFLPKYTRPLNGAELKSRIFIPMIRWPCRYRENPSPNTVLTEYIWVQDQPDSEEQEYALDCIRDTPGWSYTMAALDGVNLIKAEVLKGTGLPNLRLIGSAYVTPWKRAKGDCGVGVVSYVDEFVDYLKSQLE